MATDLQRIAQSSLQQEVGVIGNETEYLVHSQTARVGSKVIEAMDDAYDVWSSKLTEANGYNWEGVHSLFGASRETKYGLTVIVTEPIRRVLDVSASFMTWVLFMQLIVGIVVFVSFFWGKNGRGGNGK